MCRFFRSINSRASSQKLYFMDIIHKKTVSSQYLTSFFFFVLQLLVELSNISRLVNCDGGERGRRNEESSVAPVNETVPDKEYQYRAVASSRCKDTLAHPSTADLRESIRAQFFPEPAITHPLAVRQTHRAGHEEGHLCLTDFFDLI